MVIVPLGAGGTVSLFSEAGTHLLADVTGYFSLAAGPVAGGRILPLPPERVFDTRPGTAAPGPKGLVATGATLTAQVGGVAGVPLDAAAVVMNITAVQAVAEGFVTVWPTGRPRPEASTLNVTPQEAAAPNTVIMPLGADGRLDFYADAGVHLLADVTGYVTAASAPAGIIVHRGKIYWANQGLNQGGTTIGRANLDGTGAVQDFITGAHSPAGLVTDGTYLYWANFGGMRGKLGTTIGRARLDGSEVSQRFIRGAKTPVGLAVGPRG